MDFTILLYIIFGVLPSLVWLFYYLAKDRHPEPKKSILIVFLLGALATIPALAWQLGWQYLLGKNGFLFTFWGNLANLYLVIALSEELVKYAVVKFWIKVSADVDEPVDAMVYMVVSALGFAALENTLYLFHPVGTLISLQQLVEMTLALSFIRFVGATCLHTLSSSIVGYCMAMEMQFPKKRFLSTEAGLVIAIALHGTYDLFIMKLQAYQTFLIILAILLSFVILVAYEFHKLALMKGITQVEIDNKKS